MSYTPFHVIGPDRGSPIVILCDHATNTVPPMVANGDLGLTTADMSRHIAFDVGAAGVATQLGAALDAPVCLSDFSRLVIDPNRGEDDPTLIMQLYDGSVIPGNRALDDAERARRLSLFYRPYHDAVAGVLAQRENPVIVSIHSFTPQLRGRPARPWHVSILSADDRRLSDPLLANLRALPDLCVGDNEPYTGALTGDTLDRHALAHGRLHTLIEIRNDLIRDAGGQAAWADRLAPLLKDAISKASDQGEP